MTVEASVVGGPGHGGELASEPARPAGPVEIRNLQSDLHVITSSVPACHNRRRATGPASQAVRHRRLPGGFGERRPARCARSATYGVLCTIIACEPGADTCAVASARDGDGEASRPNCASWRAGRRRDVDGPRCAARAAVPGPGSACHWRRGPAAIRARRGRRCRPADPEPGRGRDSAWSPPGDDRATVGGGWRSLPALRRPGNASGYSAIVVTGGPTWPGRSAAPTPAGRAAPVALHWDGRSWRATSGCRPASPASSATQARRPRTTSGLPAQYGGYVLRWDGAAGGRPPVAAGRARPAHRRQPADVWVFGTTVGRGPAWHWHLALRRHAWQRWPGRARSIYRASAVSAQRHLGDRRPPSAAALVEHYDGRSLGARATGRCWPARGCDDMLAVSAPQRLGRGQLPAATPASASWSRALERQLVRLARHPGRCHARAPRS